MISPDWQRAKSFALNWLAQSLPANLYYHGIHHTRDDVLPAAEQLASMLKLGDEELLLLRTAALYHDIGFVEQYQANEPVAQRIAQETLPELGYSHQQIERIGEIILATQLPQQPRDLLQKLMCDADMDSLGREDFLEISLSLRAELAEHGVSIPLPQWYERQLAFLSNHRYFTRPAQQLRNVGKQKNLALLQTLLA